MSKSNSKCGAAAIARSLSQKGARVHFVGIGGVGMYSLFRITRSLGIAASGSDVRPSPLFSALREGGEAVLLGHSVEAVRGASLVVYSLAVSESDLELNFAEESGIPVASRAEYLGYLMRSYERVITVSGSHGKSTTASMLFAALRAAGQRPSAVVGASLPETGEPLCIASRELAVVEACEYKDSFLYLAPSLALFTNLELDHTDYFKDLASIKNSFLAAFDSAKLALYNRDDVNLRELAAKSSAPLVSFGAEAGADYRAVNIAAEGGRYSFEVTLRGKPLAAVSLSTVGAFSVYNALGAFAAAHLVGAAPEAIAAALSEFRGVERRFQILGRLGAFPVVYDYAHHPSELRAVIRAARECFSSPVTVAFRPHTYTRTRDLWEHFVEALSEAERVLVLEIDPVREEPIAGISAERLAADIGARARAVSFSEAAELLANTEMPVLLLGAANIAPLVEALSPLMGGKDGGGVAAR